MMQAGNVRPLGSKVLVEREDFEETVRPSGLAIVSFDLPDVLTATVVAVGEGARHPVSGTLLPPEVSAGDTVIYSKYTEEIPITVEGRKLYIVDEAAFMAKETA